MSAEVYDDVEPPRGLVADEGRGPLPFALVHGEALVARAAWAMADAGVLLLDARTPWEDVAGRVLVIHDPCCPLTPTGFIAACVERAAATGAVVVGVRPVTDTVKALHDVDGVRVVGETVDREGLLAVCSPVVLPGSVTAAFDDYPGPDLRVTSADDLRLLEALTPESA
jgi:2-C-methyl-D-erythritol 4-phosphate cytidylyltransferase